MTCCYSAHTGNEVSSCVGGVAERPPSVCVYFGLEEAVCFKVPFNCVGVSVRNG